MMLNRIIPGRVTQFWDSQDNTWHSQEFEASECGYWVDPESGDYLDDQSTEDTYLRPEMLNPTMDVLITTRGNTVLHCERWNGSPSLNRALLCIPGVDVGDLDLLKVALFTEGFLEVEDARVTLHTIKTHVVEEDL